MLLLKMLLKLKHINVSNEGVQLAETNVIINEAEGPTATEIQISEMLDELPKGNSRNKPYY